MFYSLCYPTLSDESNDFIQSFRAKNATGLHIAGTLEGITLCEYDGSVINNLEYVPFDTVK